MHSGENVRCENRIRLSQCDSHCAASRVGLNGNTRRMTNNAARTVRTTPIAVFNFIASILQSCKPKRNQIFAFSSKLSFLEFLFSRRKLRLSCLVYLLKLRMTSNKSRNCSFFENNKIGKIFPESRRSVCEFRPSVFRVFVFGTFA